MHISPEYDRKCISTIRRFQIIQWAVLLNEIKSLLIYLWYTRIPTRISLTCVKQCFNTTYLFAWVSPSFFSLRQHLFVCCVACCALGSGFTDQRKTRERGCCNLNLFNLHYNYFYSMPIQLCLYTRKYVNVFAHYFCSVHWNRGQKAMAILEQSNMLY